MALGDKLPVVMGREKAAPEGVATLGADGVLAESQRPGLAQIRGGSNPQLLINGDFRNPVNRNGQTEYTGTGYMIDRWKSTNGNITVNILSDGIKLTAATSGNGYFRHFFEQLLPAGTYTCSALVRGTGSGHFNLSNSLYDFFGDGAVIDNPGSDWTLVTNTLTSEENVFIQAYFRCDSGTSFEIKACKLEKGPIQTLARQNANGEWEIIDPPDYDLQYLLCSQYSPATGEWVGSQHSNSNLLDNGYFMDPINQRGKTEYLDFGQAIDRWAISPGVSLNIENGYARLKVNNYDQNSYVILSQKIENRIFEAIRGKTVTLSILTVNGLACVTYNIPSTGTFDSTHAKVDGKFRINLAYTSASSNLSFRVYAISSEANPGDYLDIKAVKLELGPVQTLAHKEGGTWVLNDPPSNYQQELAKCQRYQLAVPYARMRAAALNTGGVQFSLPIPVPLRAKPTIVNAIEGSTYSIVDGLAFSGSATGFSLSITSIPSGLLAIAATKANHGLTDACLFIQNIIFDANL